MSKRSSTSTKTINPSGFSFTIKHKAPSSGNSMSIPKIDLSKPVIKFKAKSAYSGNSSSKKGGRKTRKHTMRKKTHRKKHARKTHRKKNSSKTRRKK